MFHSQQGDNVLSGALLVAYLADPDFDGKLTYSAPDYGNLVGGKGSVEVFASGLRNPYGVTLHSNGNLYGTDNGSNLGYGDMMTDCNGASITDEYTFDKINLYSRGRYYGHPNQQRGKNGDTRQCKWHGASAPSDGEYTAPLIQMTPSTDGIMEWQTDHFDGQLRYNLIVSKYTGSLYRIILNPSGTAVLAASDPAIPLVGDEGLEVTQAPDGTLIEVRNAANSLFFHQPLESSNTIVSKLIIKSVFPRRGGQAGGTNLSIYGINFTGTLTATVGGTDCPIVTMTVNRIVCKLPGGKAGTVNIVVTNNAKETSTFNKGYRYIVGK
jgi:IPT/TIG domain/Glucose / Sorbosone dehydrogenase